MRSALNSRSFAAALRNPRALRDPNTRAYITALAATAGWRNARGVRIGWWQHDNGGYGWVGPLFWPFAYDDIYDYAILGYGPSFWELRLRRHLCRHFRALRLRGTRRLSTSILRSTGATPNIPGPRFARENLRSINWRKCAAKTAVALIGLPIEQIQQTIALTDEQRAALNDLAKALAKAADDIKAVCPTEISLTAPGRLAAMQQRL